MKKDDLVVAMLFLVSIGCGSSSSEGVSPRTMAKSSPGGARPPDPGLSIACSGSHDDHWTRDRVHGSIKVVPEKMVGVLSLRIDRWEGGYYHSGQEQLMDLGCREDGSEIFCSTKDQLYEARIAQDNVGDHHATFNYKIGNGLDSFAMSCPTSEVDLVLGREVAVEFKATRQVLPKHLKGLRALRDEGLVREYWIVSQDTEERIVDGIRVLPWQRYLEELEGLGMRRISV